MRARAERDVVGDQALRVVDLSKSFGGVHALRGVSLDISRGQILGIIGPNGAGKTSLVNAISGRERPTAGSVMLDGLDVTGRSPDYLSRRGLTRSYQQSNIFAEASVEENLARAAEFAGRRAVGVDAHLQATGLDAVLNSRSGSLPYGLQKMLGLVMSLSTGPSVVLMDEPAAGLEAGERPQVDRLVATCAEGGCAVLIVEHDMDMIRRLCPTVMVLDAGALLAAGPTAEVLARPDVLAAYLGVGDTESESSDG